MRHYGVLKLYTVHSLGILAATISVSQLHNKPNFLCALCHMQCLKFLSFAAFGVTTAKIMAHFELFFIRILTNDMRFHLPSV